MVTIFRIIALLLLCNCSELELVADVEPFIIGPVEIEEKASSTSDKVAENPTLKVAPIDPDYWKYLKFKLNDNDQVHIKGLPFLLSLTIENSYSPLPSDLMHDPYFGIRTERKRDVRHEEIGTIRTNSAINRLFSVFDVLDADVPLRIKMSPGEVSLEPASSVYDQEWEYRAYGLYNKYSQVREEIGDLFPINGGERIELLVDIGYRLGQFESGDITAEYTAVSNRRRGFSYDVGETKISIREMSENEKSLLESSLGIELDLSRGPRDWIVAEMDISPGFSNLDTVIRDKVILSVFLNQVSKLDDALSMDLSLLDLFPDHLAKYASLFKYETLLASGQIDEAKSLREEVLSRHPGLEWRFRAADMGDGHIARSIGFYKRELVLDAIRNGQTPVQIDELSAFVESIRRNTEANRLDLEKSAGSPSPEVSTQEENEKTSGANPENRWGYYVLFLILACSTAIWLKRK